MVTWTTHWSSHWCLHRCLIFVTANWDRSPFFLLICIYNTYLICCFFFWKENQIGMCQSKQIKKCESMRAGAGHWQSMITVITKGTHRIMHNFPQDFPRDFPSTQNLKMVHAARQPHRIARPSCEVVKHGDSWGIIEYLWKKPSHPFAHGTYQQMDLRLQ